MQIHDGKLSIARQINCPNFDERPDGEVSLIVIHCISLPAAHFGSNYVEALFCNEISGTEHDDFGELGDLKVSSHLFIRRDGEVLQFVAFDKRAWHAGNSSYRGRSNCNDYSVGVELEGVEDGEYADSQYSILRQICQEMLKTWSLGPESIVGHCDIAPGRKTDPGDGFDWNRLRDGLL